MDDKIVFLICWTVVAITVIIGGTLVTLKDIKSEKDSDGRLTLEEVRNALREMDKDL